MAFSLSALAQFGLGFGRGRAAAEDKKQRDRQQLLAMTSRALQQKQAGQDRAQSERDRQANADGALDYRKQHDTELMDTRREALAATEENRRQNVEGARQNRQIKTLQDYITGAGTGRFANLSPPQQTAAVQGMNAAGGTALPVPGAPDGGTRPKNYGLPPAQAGGVNAAIDLFGGETPTTPTTTPYFGPTPDQVAVRAQKGAATAHTLQATREAPQRLAETGRHNRAAEGTARAGQGERSRHDGIAESQGAARIDQGMMRVLQGSQRVQQGGERLRQSSARAGGGQGSYKDPVEAVQKRLTEMSKPGKFNILTNANGPAIKDTPEGRQEYAHLMNTRKRLLALPVGPDGARVQPFGNVNLGGFRPANRAGAVAPYAPPLPGASLPSIHHSLAQPRHTTGEKAGRFKRGAPDLSKMTTQQLLGMLGKH